MSSRVSKFLYPSIVHFDDPVAAICETAIVSGHQERGTFIGDQVHEQFEDHGTALLIERACRLICQ